ncbi:MAG TPA: hypothetical protein PLV25_05700, partial [Opitutales bacterium]|nr:hypothetical protein [Opitutales bacterium]
ADIPCLIVRFGALLEYESFKLEGWLNCLWVTKYVRATIKSIFNDDASNLRASLNWGLSIVSGMGSWVHPLDKSPTQPLVEPMQSHFMHPAENCCQQCPFNSCERPPCENIQLLRSTCSSLSIVYEEPEAGV